MTPLLDLRGLTVSFPMDEGRFAAVDGVDLSIGEGEFVGVVGEYLDKRLTSKGRAA